MSEYKEQAELVSMDTIKEQLTVVTEQRNRAWEAVNDANFLFDKYLQVFGGDAPQKWREYHQQAIDEADIGANE